MFMALLHFFLSPRLWTICVCVRLSRKKKEKWKLLGIASTLKHIRLPHTPVNMACSANDLHYKVFCLGEISLLFQNFWLHHCQGTAINNTKRAGALPPILLIFMKVSYYCSAHFFAPVYFSRRLLPWAIICGLSLGGLFAWCPHCLQT